MLQQNVRRELNMSGQGLPVCRTKCPARLKAISHALIWSSVTVSVALDSTLQTLLSGGQIWVAQNLENLHELWVE